MPVCAKCGEGNPGRARFCLACAAPLEPGDPEGRDSLKTVSIVFCDMTGSTALGEALDAESIRMVMDRYYREMRAALERHGGTVSKFIGDAVMAVFGIPVVHEDDAVRAVRAATDMRAGLDALNEELEERWGIRIGTRTGVNTGEVVAGDPGEEESYVVGDTVNVAARLEQVAGTGEILLGADTYRLVRDVATAEPVEPLALKGKSEPVPAYRLLHLREQDAEAGPPDTTLIGREADLEQLEQALKRAIADRRPSLMTVVGAAGIGKTTLGSEFVQRVSGRASVLRGHCVAYGEGITFSPVTEVLRQSAGIIETDAPGEVREKLAAPLGTDRDAAAIAERLAALLGIGVGSSNQEETFWAMARYLEALATVHPLLVIFDDIHWAEPTFLDLLEYLGDRESDAPLLIVALARPEVRELRRHLVRGSNSIVLEPLDTQASARVIQSRLGGELPAAVAARITEAAEGNPLFVEEMLRMLIDDGYLRRENDGWSLVRKLSDDTIPPTIDALLGARLDRLRDRERDVAQRASVAGKVFPREALTELCPERVRPELGVHLDSLRSKEVIAVDDSSQWEDDSYRFHHVLVRDAAYRSMLKETRAELHERFADWLSTRTGRAEAEHEELVGYHLEQAYRLRERLGPVGERGENLARRAADALASSARRALARGDMPAAANLAERALVLIADGDGDRSDLGLLLTSALLELGDAERAGEALECAATDARGDRLREAHVSVQRAYLRLFTYTHADHTELTDTANEAIPVFEQADDQLGLARAWRIWSTRPWSEGRVAEATIALARSFEHAQAAGDAREEVATFQWLLAAHYSGPTTADEGVELCESFAERADRDRSSHAGLLHVRGAFHMFRGEIERGRSLYEQGQEIYRELGQRHTAALAATIAADAEMQAGEAGRAEALLRPAVHTLIEVGNRSYTTEAAALLSGALFTQGNVEEAVRYANISEESAIQGDIMQAATWRIVRALVLVAHGEVDEAERRAQEACDLLADADALNLRADAALTLAGVLMARDRAGEATPLVQAALEAFEKKGNVLGAQRARDLLQVAAA